MNIKKIEAYSLFEFCQTVEQNIKDGWKFDFESNENFPSAYGSMLVAGMVKDIAMSPKDTISKDNADTIPDTAEDNTQEYETVIKRGRKSKQ